MRGLGFHNLKTRRSQGLKHRKLGVWPDLIDEQRKRRIHEDVDPIHTTDLNEPELGMFELAPGNVIQEVGTVLDASEYVPSDPAPFARVMVRVQSPIVYYP